MQLTKYDPTRFLNRMQDEINDFFHQNGNRGFPAVFDEMESWTGMEWSPRVDIKEEDKQFIVTADIPGVDPKDIDVTMENGILRIYGERKIEKEEKKKNYRMQECSYGTFERLFRMPESADSDNIKAKGKNGVLTITIAKSPETTPRKITIES